MTGAIVGVLLLTVNPIGGRSIGSGCEMRPPSSRPGSRLWRGYLFLSTRHAVRRKAASAPSINLLSAPLPIPLVCCDIHGFRRVSRGGEAMARRQKEERRVGSASRGIVRRLGCCSSRARHRVVPERAADGGIVYVWQARSASPRALRIHAQRVARYAPYNAHNCLPPKKLRREIP
jgi:hypothetical protein